MIIFTLSYILLSFLLSLYRSVCHVCVCVYVLPQSMISFLLRLVARRISPPPPTKPTRYPTTIILEESYTILLHHSCHSLITCVSKAFQEKSFFEIFLKKKNPLTPSSIAATTTTTTKTTIHFFLRWENWKRSVRSLSPLHTASLRDFSSCT